MQLFIVDLIKSVGFPIFVAVYLLVYQSKLLRENTQMLRELKDFLYKRNYKED